MGKQVNGALTRMDAVKSWFYSQKMPYWTLYRGNPISKYTNEAIIARNWDFDDMDEGYNLLESILKEYENGLFTIFAKPKPEGNGGVKIQYSPGIVEDIPGINGVGGKSPAPYLGSINEIIDEKKKMWELEREVEDLKASINGKASFGEKIFGLLEQNMPQLLENVIPLIIQRMGGSQMPGAIAGPIKTERAAESNEMDPINASLLRISQHFDLEEILPKLADWVEKNPMMAKNLLNNL